RRLTHDVNAALYIPKKARITPEIVLLQQYVRIDTSNPPGNELPGARFLAALIEEAGVKAEIIESAPRRANVYARIKGKKSVDGVKYAITEGGVTEMQKETVTYYGIEIGSKQRVELDLVANDEATLQRARIALEPYFRPGDPDRVLPGVREFFRAVAPRRLEFRDLLANIDATIAAGKFWLLPVTMRELTQNSVWAREIRQLPDGRFAM